MPRAELVRLYAAADVLVLTSTIEGMPMVILEGLATGCPVAVTDVGDLRRSSSRAGMASWPQSRIPRSWRVRSCRGAGAGEALGNARQRPRRGRCGRHEQGGDARGLRPRVRVNPERRHTAEQPRTNYHVGLIMWH